MPWTDAIYCLRTSSLPSFAEVVYSYLDTAWVVRMRVGTGAVYFLTFDWFTQPVPAGWKCVLEGSTSKWTSKDSSGGGVPIIRIPLLFDSSVVDTSEEAAHTYSTVDIVTTIATVTKYTSVSFFWSDLPTSSLEAFTTAAVIPELETFVDVEGQMSASQKSRVAEFVTAGA